MASSNIICDFKQHEQKQLKMESMVWRRSLCFKTKRPKQSIWENNFIMWIKVNFHCHIATWVSNSDIFAQYFLSAPINENYTEIKMRRFRELSMLFTSGKAWSNEPVQTVIPLSKAWNFISYFNSTPKYLNSIINTVNSTFYVYEFCYSLCCYILLWNND